MMGSARPGMPRRGAGKFEDFVWSPIDVHIVGIGISLLSGGVEPLKNDEIATLAVRAGESLNEDKAAPVDLSSPERLPEYRRVSLLWEHI
jgi:hypothetical protein